VQFHGLFLYILYLAQVFNYLLQFFLLSESNYVESQEVDLKIFISSSVSSHSSDDILLVCRNIRNTARLVDMPPNVCVCYFVAHSNTNKHLPSVV
jgi:hypothetical protein